MKDWMSFAFIMFFTPTLWAAPKYQNIYEEHLYDSYKSLLSSNVHHSKKNINGFIPSQQKIFVDALWDLIENEGNASALMALEGMSVFHYELVERLRVDILRIKYKRATSLSSELAEDLKSALLLPEVQTRVIYLIAAYEKELLAAGHANLVNLARLHTQFYDISEDEVRKQEITDDLIADLFYNSPDITEYMNGEYIRSVKIFMFCRENRLYPCLMTMRNVHGEIVRNEDGSLWTNPALASSARGLPSYTRNGNTPAGVHSIDSVMPDNDQQISFGKFRRMIVNFIPREKNEVYTKALLPETHKNLKWWKAASVARDIGRNLLRIHGTGKINRDPSTPYFPFMRTSGCIAQRENTYNGYTFRDQRDLLDDIMKALELEPTYDNEVKIKGILYLVELDDTSAPVLPEDLAAKGIE